MRYRLGCHKPLGALGDDSTDSTDSGSTPTVLQDISSAGTSLVNLFNQEQLNRINLQRASQGLAPLPQSVIGPTVSVGLSSGVQNLLIYGGLGIAALFVVNAVLKHRR